MSGYKESVRRNMSAAVLSAGLRVSFQNGSSTVESACFAFGGIALGKTSAAVKTSKNIIGR